MAEKSRNNSLEKAFQKVYKSKQPYNNRMFPSDPTGSLDDFFSELNLICNPEN